MGTIRSFQLFQDYSKSSKCSFKMRFSGLINVVMILMAATFAKTLMADPRTDIAASECNNSSALSSSVYASNFIPAMSNLSDLVNQNGFGTTVVGEGPNAVFALAQCYNDLNSSDCGLCFSEIRSILPTCYSTGGRLFLDGCFGRYENFSFFDQGIDSIIIKNCSSIKNSYLPDKFGEVVKKVVENVSLKAQNSNGFAVESGSESNLSVHALAQCWDSLNERTCNSCLQAAASSIITCSPAVEGRSLYAGCYLRYSTEVFWNSIQSTENSSGKHKSLWIILGAVIGGCLLLTGIGLWKAKKWLGGLHGKFLKDSHGSGLSAAISQSKLFKYQVLKRATKNFESSNKLGQGSYGTVYKGILPDGRDVAVKRLFLNTRQWVDQFVNEVDLVNQVRHKNLVKLLGCSVDGPESLLVFEYCFNKSLNHFLFDKNKARVLDWKKRFDIVQGVAEGLSYLHRESEIQIIHRDIKASNILLSDKFRPKITDFGLARSFAEDQTHLSTGIAGTLGYMAPEYAIHGHLTEKADVYSFGVLTLEIVTGKRCSNALGAKPGQHLLAMIWSHYKAKTMERIIDRSFYEEAVEDEILHVVHVGLLCTQATPSYRPTMAKVVELLRSKRDQGDVIPTDPPFLDFIASENQEEGEILHVISLDSAPGSSGSSGSLMYGR